MKEFFCTLLCVSAVLLMLGCSQSQDVTQSKTPPAIETQSQEALKTQEDEENQEIKEPQEQIKGNTQEQDIILYFADLDVMYLHPEVRTVSFKEGELERVILEELFKGPQEKHLQKTVYGDPEVLDVNTSDGVCTINLSASFADNNTGGSTRELFAVFSIVNSLCELETIQSVKINIEGNNDYPFGGHFTLIDPFEADNGMIAVE